MRTGTEQGRAFTGAWVETSRAVAAARALAGRAFTGAWVETPGWVEWLDPETGRAFTGAWVETCGDQSAWPGV